MENQPVVLNSQISSLDLDFENNDFDPIQILETNINDFERKLIAC